MNETTPTPPPTPKRTPILYFGIGCGSLFLLCILCFGGIAVYGSWQRSQLVQAAADNRAKGEYEAAIQNLKELIETFGSSEDAAEARKQIPQIQLEWAASLRDKGEFEAALQVYQQIQDTGPDTIEIGEEVFATRIAWAQALMANQQFAQAKEQLFAVTEAAGEGSAQGDLARSLLPQAHLGTAEQAIIAGDVPTAYGDYLYIFDNYASGPGREAALTSFQTNFTTPLFTFGQTKAQDEVFSDAALAYDALVLYAPDSAEAEQARTLAPEVYYLWGQQLVEEALFDEAIETFKYLLQNYPNNTWAEQAQTALIDAQVAAVAASGEAGALPAPQTAGESNSGDDTATYSVENDTICPILLLASGPGSQSLQIPAQNQLQAEFVPGSYNVVVQTDSGQELSAECQDIIPFTGEYEFEGGYIYESSFYIETTDE